MLHARAGYRSARPPPSICSNPACNARPVHTKVPQAEVVSASKVSPVSAVPTTGKVAFSSFAPESTA
jgi:hypothetical protein